MTPEMEKRLLDEIENYRRTAKSSFILMQKQLNQIKLLKDALHTYRHCRHGSIDCFCTQEARSALAGPEWTQ